jgi:hypothetical protein
MMSDNALAKDTDLSSNSIWTVGTLRDYFITLIGANDKRYIEEHRLIHDLMNAADRRYEERFNSQEASVVLSFAAQEKGVSTALLAQEKLINTSFSSVQSLFEKIMAERETRHDQVASAKEKAVYNAITDLRHEGEQARLALKDSLAISIITASNAVQKAEIAAEKRFDGVNEFRATLADQQRNLIPRTEVDVLVQGINEKIATQAMFINDQNNRVIALAATVSGRSEGTSSGWGYAVGAIGLVIAVMSIIFTVINHVGAPVAAAAH